MCARSQGLVPAIAAGLLLLPVLAVAANPAPSAGAPDGGSLTAATWDEALDLARRHDRPILAYFFTEW